ncbi:MAG: cupin domain-containing protein [Desulfuromonadales bacterium]|nr:cupin domain-containing protein [Desulfuromonadales bacterium]
MHKISNILTDLPSALTGEVFDALVESSSVRIERIVSNGQATPEGEWYEQGQDEWVLLLAGSAGLLFDDAQEPRRLGAGDHILIPAGCRHRVAWTDPDVKTVWLAVHFAAAFRA